MNLLVGDAAFIDPEDVPVFPVDVTLSFQTTQELYQGSTCERDSERAPLADGSLRRLNRQVRQGIGDLRLFWENLHVLAVRHARQRYSTTAHTRNGDGQAFIPYSQLCFLTYFKLDERRRRYPNLPLSLSFAKQRQRNVITESER